MLLTLQNVDSGGWATYENTRGWAWYELVSHDLPRRLMCERVWSTSLPPGFALTGRIKLVTNLSARAGMLLSVALSVLEAKPI